jgi:hypothetical protein
MKQKTAFLLLFLSSLIFTASIVSYRPTEGEAADWSKPTLSDAYSDFLTYMKALTTDAATMFSGTPTNTPTGAMKWNRTTDLLQEWSGAAWVDQPVSVAGGGTGSSTQSGARTNLGLGTMATQASGAVSITGGAISGITDLPVVDGGTGSSTASGARTNLGAAASGANSDITSISNVATVANSGGHLYVGPSTAHNTYFKSNGSDRMLLVHAELSLRPASDGGMVLGQPSVRWTGVYAFDYIETVNAAVSAAGTDLSGATQLSATINYISSGSANQGVKLENKPVGAKCIVFNATGNDIKVYPPTGSQEISNFGVGNSFDLKLSTNVKAAAFYKVSSTDWIAVPTGW